MIALVALSGAGLGLGLLVAVRALRPAPVPLAHVLAGLDGAGRPSEQRRDRGAIAHRVVLALGLRIDASHPDFLVAERFAEAHALAKLTGAVAGATASGFLAAALAAVGVPVALGVSALFVVGATVGGFLLPDYALREEASRRRRDFRHALSAYLDLVNVILAGGGGLDSALHAAADAGDGPAFAQLRHALSRARLTNRSPWDVFGELGDRLDVHELRELGASVSLAGTHGARIRASLAAKADALRGHQQAEVEADAEAATERMTIPVAVLLFGFLVFIAYPALVQITSITQTR